MSRSSTLCRWILAIRWTPSKDPSEGSSGRGKHRHEGGGVLKRSEHRDPAVAQRVDVGPLHHERPPGRMGAAPLITEHDDRIALRDKRPGPELLEGRELELD